MNADFFSYLLISVKYQPNEVFVSVKHHSTKYIVVFTNVSLAGSLRLTYCYWQKPSAATAVYILLIIICFPSTPVSWSTARWCPLHIQAWVNWWSNYSLRSYDIQGDPNCTVYMTYRVILTALSTALWNAVDCGWEKITESLSTVSVSVSPQLWVSLHGFIKQWPQCMTRSDIVVSLHAASTV